jgi:secreted Zn-dependent insulinase-like peptidase
MQVEVSDFTLFRLTLGLTEEGLKHIDDIVAMVYRYLSLMTATPPQKYIQVSYDTCESVFAFHRLY